MHINRAWTHPSDAPSDDDAALLALTRVADATLAPRSRDRFDLLVEMNTTVPELAAVFGLPDPTRRADA